MKLKKSKLAIYTRGYCSFVRSQARSWKLKSKRCIDLNSFCVEVGARRRCFSSGCIRRILSFFVSFVATSTACRSHSMHSILSRRYREPMEVSSGEGQIKCQNEKLVHTRRRGGNKWIKLAAEPRIACKRIEHLVVATARQHTNKTKQSFAAWAFIYAFNERE